MLKLRETDDSYGKVSTFDTVLKRKQFYNVFEYSMISCQQLRLQWSSLSNDA